MFDLAVNTFSSYYQRAAVQLDLRCTGLRPCRRPHCVVSHCRIQAALLSVQLPGNVLEGAGMAEK